ncbi:MAG TPA: cytochrome P450 [Candidatus Binataceae bacterium]
MKNTFIDLKNPDLYRDGIPHEVFARLRREAPVAWNPEDDGRGFWAVTRYEDIVAVSKNPKAFSSARKHGGHRMFDENVVGVAGVGADKTEAPMISMDPPEHNQYRRMVSPGFAPRRVQALEDRIRDRVIGILDRLAGADTCDFVADIAAELPIQMLAELMGVPQEDRAMLFEWSNALIAEDDAEYRSSPEVVAEKIARMAEYALNLWQERFEHPGDDLISMLVHSRVDGEAMTRERYIGTFILLVAAGNETTRNSLSGGFLALAEHPADKRRLIEDPSLLPGAAAEIVRWVSPVMHMRRTAVEEAEIGGQTVRPNDKVILWYCSGNRDEAVFADPFRFDITRTDPAHVGFGTGQHFCLGARLAEVQIRVFYEEFLRRYPDACPVGPIERMRSNFIVGYKSIPTRLVGHG